MIKSRYFCLKKLFLFCLFVLSAAYVIAILQGRGVHLAHPHCASTGRARLRAQSALESALSSRARAVWVARFVLVWALPTACSDAARYSTPASAASAVLITGQTGHWPGPPSCWGPPTDATNFFTLYFLKIYIHFC